MIIKKGDGNAELRIKERLQEVRLQEVRLQEARLQEARCKL